MSAVCNDLPGTCLIIYTVVESHKSYVDEIVQLWVVSYPDSCDLAVALKACDLVHVCSCMGVGSSHF